MRLLDLMAMTSGSISPFSWNPVRRLSPSLVSFKAIRSQLNLWRSLCLGRPKKYCARDRGFTGKKVVTILQSVRF